MNIAYRLSSPSIVSEVIDGEAIIMDMRTGIYYSADGVGAHIWEALLAGADRQAIVEWASALSAAGGAAAASFIDKLVSSELLTAGPEGARDTDIAFPRDLSYSPPLLAIHGDMEDLIRLDPIHDVCEEEGWPVRPELVTHGNDQDSV